MAASDEDVREVKAPLALLAMGILLLMLGAWRIGGAAGIGAALPPVAVRTAVEVVLMLVGAMVTARLIGVSFGAPTTAALKLAAVVVLPAGAALAVNITGISWVISVILYLGLLVYLFELDLREALIFTGVMIVIRIVVNFIMAGMS